MSLIDIGIRYAEGPPDTRSGGFFVDVPAFFEAVNQQ